MPRICYDAAGAHKENLADVNFASGDWFVCLKMPKAQIKIKRKFSARSDRVKSVDIHPTEPWMLVALYNGKVQVINVHSQDIAKSFDVCDLPVRAACFVARMRWVVCGADDMKVRVFNYNTAEKVVAFDAHNDYIRTIAVHPTQGLLLTGSDDMSIKMWDWNKAWACVMTFEGHSHYVMEVVFSPRDPNTFASASLDKTIKVWGLNSSSAHFTLEGHEKGVNCVDYFSGDKPFLASGSDDSSVKIWDYQTRTCVQTLEGHSNNVASVKFHHDRPLILSGGEDGQCIVWNSATFKLESRLDYQMERVWSIGLVKGTNRVALGCDEGSVLLKLGKDSPIASMDSSGKIIWANNNEIQTVNSKSATGDDMVDGEKLALAVKDLGTCDFVPDQMKHSPNGRLVAVVGDGEFIIYTALAWRNKAFGTAVEFVWGSDSNFYATREGSTTVKVWKGFAEFRVMRVEYAVDGIFGGPYLCIRSGETLLFHDWETGLLVFNIGSNAKVCLWNDSSSMLAVCSDSQFFVLQVNRDNVQAYLEGSARSDEGCLNALDVLYEISDKVRACKWIGDVLVFTSSTDRLSYCLGGNVQPIAHLDRRMFLLGYMPNLNRVFLVDKMFNVVSYELLSSVLDFQNAVVRGDIELAESLVKTIPESSRNKVARFVESLGHPALALDISRDNDYKCDLAMQLGRLDLAKELVLASPSENKWRHLGDLALKKGQIALADSCMLQAGDVNSLLLLRSSLGDAKGIKELSAMAQSKGRLNVAFVCEYMLGNADNCIVILQKFSRHPEAAMLARSYKPSAVSDCVKLWKSAFSLEKSGDDNSQDHSSGASFLFSAKQRQAIADSIGDPIELPNFFPKHQLHTDIEAMLQSQKRDIPSSESSQYSNWLHRDLSAELMSNGQPEASPISSSCSASAPAVSESDVSQQLQSLSVASPDVELQSPPKPVSPAAEPITSASIPSDDDEIADTAEAPVTSSQAAAVASAAMEDFEKELDESWGE